MRRINKRQITMSLFYLQESSNGFFQKTQFDNANQRLCESDQPQFSEQAYQSLSNEGDNESYGIQFYQEIQKYLDQTATMIESLTMKQYLHISNQKEIPKKQKKERQENCIASNMVRQLKKIIKQEVYSDKQTRKQLSNFISNNKIKSQIWGVDALFIQLIFLRDCEHKIQSNEYTRILQRFLMKISQKNQRATNSPSKHKINLYKELVTKYLDSSLDFWNLDQFLLRDGSIFKDIIKKRASLIQDYITLLINIIDSHKTKSKAKGFQRKNLIRIT